MSAERNPSMLDDEPAPSSDLFQVAAALFDMADDPARRQEVLRMSVQQVTMCIDRPVSEEERLWLADLVESARATCQNLLAAEQGLRIAAAGLDVASVGLVLIGEQGSIIHANETAKQFLAFSATRRSDLLDRAVAQSRAGSSDVVRISTDGARTLQLRRLRLEECGTFIGDAPGQAFLVTAVDGAAGPSQSTIETALGVTPAEARLCAKLAQGHSVSAAAALLGIRMPTARTQLRSVFAKTGTRRQAELMLTLSSLPLNAV